MSPQKITEDNKKMMIANCRICLLSKTNCSNCPLNWALDFLDIEKTLKIFEIPLKIEITMEDYLIGEY